MIRNTSAPPPSNQPQRAGLLSDITKGAKLRVKEMIKEWMVDLTLIFMKIYRGRATCHLQENH